MGLSHVPWRRAFARGVSALLAATAVLSWRPADSAPADIFSSPAPTLGADPPKATALKDGDASVSSQTGALSYTYPIAVPPGRNGMAPSLALSHGSQGAIYGGIASGWDLSIPMIIEDHSRGRLATRAPEVEATQSGVDAKVDDRFVSTMSGGQRLVLVDEGGTKPAEVYERYRAIGDASYTRYERMDDGHPFRWRAWTADGNVMEFGDASMGHGCTFSDQFAPLTKASDAFGNLIAYEWEGADGECRIKEISWGQNAGAGLPNAFARVAFSYAFAGSCTTMTPPSIAVGSQRDYRSGPLQVTGASKLTRITATAFPPGQAGAPEHTRQITLTYDDDDTVPNRPNTESCTAGHAPYRQLASIQESAWGTNAPRVNLPAIKFHYRPAAALSTEHPGATPWAYSSTLGNVPRDNLAWGYRRLDARWPTVEAMLVDIDGDGRVDRVTNAAADPGTGPTGAPIYDCGAWWQRNEGLDANGNPTFATALEYISLPRLKWRGTVNTPAGSPTALRRDPNAVDKFAQAEGCALNGMYTSYRNVMSGSGLCHDNTNTCSPGLTVPGSYCPGGTECPISGAGTSDTFRTYVAYRWLDADADGLVDLVAAVHGNSNVYDIEYGNRVDATGDYRGYTDGSGYHVGEPSISGIPAAGQWPACPAQADRCKDTSALRTCINRWRTCNGGACTFGWADFNSCLTTAPERACFDVLAKAGPNDGTPQALEVRRPYTRCEGLYPWLIYKNLGAGQFAEKPIIKYQPIPLESDMGDSAMTGPSMVAQHHAIMDFDGDGILDAVAHGKPGTGQSAAGYFVWLGDGTGGFGTKRYVYPTRYEGGGGDPDRPWGSNALSGNGPVTSSILESKLGLLDVHGDGLPDHWLAPFGTMPATNVAVSDGVQQRVFGSSLSTATGELTLPPGLKPGSDADYVYDVVGGPNPTDPIFAGRSSARGRVADLDADGRPDYVALEPSVLTWWNAGGQFYQRSGAPYLTGPTTGVLPDPNAGLLRRTRAIDTGIHPVDPYRWELLSDLVDLDGNGFAEAVSFVNGYTRVTEPTPTSQPPRLLWKIENGRGARTEVAYAQMHDTSTVTQDSQAMWTDVAMLCEGTVPFPCHPKASPRTQWVVKSLTTIDEYSGTTSTTSYHYKHPRFGPDNDGRFAFRGFAEVMTTGPSGAKNVSRFGYDVDPTGRLVTSLTMPAVSETTVPDEVRSISTTTWQKFALFGSVTSHHAIKQESWTCANGQTEFACLGASDGYTRTTTSYVPKNSDTGGGPDLLLVANLTTLSASSTNADGDRTTSMSYYLRANEANYRLRPTVNVKQHRVQGTLETFAKSEQTWALDYRVPDETTVWMDNDPTNFVVSHAEYDPQTGNLLEKWKPKQYAAGTTRTVLTYDARKLFLASSVNEVGHQVDMLYDYGTGALVEQRGPNERTCVTGTAGCPEDAEHPVKQTRRDVIDAMGRVLEHWETVGESSTVFTMRKLATTTYVDDTGGTLPTSVLQQTLVDEVAGIWTQERTDLDGQGRPLMMTTFAQGTAPNDHITTFVYNAAGTLSSVRVPDPAANNANVVTYTYVFDSLGRPTSIRRPGATGADITYDGLSQSTKEVVGPAGGQPAETISTSDAFGRLTTLEEKTGSLAYATTKYAYTPQDLVREVVDPMNVVVEMEYDFAGRRTKITRPGNRSWVYWYDANGNVAAERVPYDGAPSAIRDTNHTTVFVYDDLDRIRWKYIAPRDLSPADRTLFASDREQFVWDLSFKGQQRLWYLYPPTTWDPIEAFDMYHDAAGRSRIEVQYAGGILGIPGALRGVERWNYASGLPGLVRFFDFGTTNELATQYYYDARGLPSRVRLIWPQAQAHDLAAYTRNVAGLVTKRTSTTGGSTYVESNWTYDALGRVVDQTVQTMPGATPVVRQQLAYFGNDDITTLTHHLGATSRQFSFTYDHRHQLTGATAIPASYFASDYTYDDAGRLTHASLDQSMAPIAGSEVRSRDVNYVYGGVDPEQVTALANVSPIGTNHATYTYDATGNQLTRSYPATNELWEYLYDGKDQLRRVTKKVSGVVQGSEEYWYDFRGQRNIVTKHGADGAKTEMIWFHGPVEAHYDGTGAVTKVYSHVELGTPVARIERPNSSTTNIEYQFHGLASNTIAAVANDGTINARFSYTPFGEVLEATSGPQAFGTEFHKRRFNDKHEDDIGGLAYYGARYYDKTLLGWTQSDPLYLRGPDLGMSSTPRRANLGAFSLNNPLRYLDPDGLDPGNFGASQFFGHCPSGSVCGAGAASDGSSGLAVGETWSTGLRTAISMGFANPVQNCGASAPGICDPKAAAPAAPPRTVHLHWKFNGPQDYLIEPGFRCHLEGRCTMPTLTETAFVFVGLAAAILIPEVVLPMLARGGTTALAAETAAVVPAAVATTQVVTRWGRQGLQAGDWVMKGGNNLLNFVLSGKWQPSWFPGANIPASRAAAQTFEIAREAVRFPTAEGGMLNPLNWIKYAIGQRQYYP